MADYDIAGLNRQLSYFKPDGNLSMLEPITLEIATKTTRAATDREFVAKLPRGVLITNVTAVVRDGTGTSGDDIDVGTVQKGTGTWTDDVDYFHDAVSIRVAATFESRRSTRPLPLKIDEDNVYLVVTWNDAIPNTVSVAMDFYVEYMVVGND